MSVPIWWPTGGPGTWWDRGVDEALLAGELWRPPVQRNFHRAETVGDGAIVVIAGQHALSELARIQSELAGARWALVILGSDEETLFPVEELRHPNMRLWVQTPRLPRHAAADRFLGVGWPPDTRSRIAGLSPEVPDKTLDWFFEGQAPPDQPSRTACVAELQRLASEGARGVVRPTPGFAQAAAGSNREAYLRGLLSAVVAPCPGGPNSPDTFRVWEALEAGALPVVENYGWWAELLRRPPPFPTIKNWAMFESIARTAMFDWPASNNRALAWWIGRKREMALWLHYDLTALGVEAEARGVHDRVTVLIPTSPIRTHPSTDKIERVMESVRSRLPLAEVIVMIDGMRPDSSVDPVAYHEYTRRLLWLCNHCWSNVLPLVFDTELHQSGKTRIALEYVRTPQVLFVEHDTPLLGDIPFAQLSDVVASGAANLIRLYHYDEIPKEHRYLYLKQRAELVGGAPLIPTIDWSQRPHLASTDFYRRMFRDYIRSSRAFIEHVMYGVVRSRGRFGWNEFRLWIYAPPGKTMVRSGHLDGRDGAEASPNVFDYEGEHPEGAPAPTV